VTGHRHLTVERWAGPCGAVVGGVDLATDLDDAVIAEIRAALMDHGVIFFHDQDLTPERQVAFSRRFGPYSPVPFVHAIPEHPEVIAVRREPTEAAGLAFGGVWHSDFSFLPEPPMASILHAIEVPPYGADTLFANQALAFSTLSPGLQRTLRGLDAVHSARDAYSPKMQGIHDRFEGMTVTTSDEANRTQVHPVVRRHAETGADTLFVNQQYTVGLDGFWGHEARPILDQLFAHATQDSFTCRWKWAPGDVAFWDNRAVQHMVMGDVSGHRRLMHRTTVAGEAPIPAREPI